MHDFDQLRSEHGQIARRYFLGLGAAGAAALALAPRLAKADPALPGLDKAGAALEPYMTRAHEFRNVGRGNPVPHTLADDKRSEVGLARDTWKLEVVPDPDATTRLRRPMIKADGTALDFAGLLELGKHHAVRFAKVMTCLNIGCPLGTGIWEGVPLREVFWRVRPSDDVRRVFYYGYHNDDPKQMFRSSLPVGRVLEDPFDLPPVILCYKLNGEWLSPERGGPVRIVVPEGYGFKSIKWLTHVVLSSMAHGNDTYADAKNDVDSPLKSFAATLSFPDAAKSGQPLAVSGYAQVGVSGVSKVQVWLAPKSPSWPADDEYFATAPWVDAELLPPPTSWGDALEDGRIPRDTFGFDADGRPKSWPMRLTKVHWAALLPAQPAGDYVLRCRTIDAKGIAQPMPRPFRKSGHAAIEAVRIVVEA